MYMVYAKPILDIETGKLHLKNAVNWEGFFIFLFIFYVLFCLIFIFFFFFFSFVMFLFFYPCNFIELILLNTL